MKSKGIVASKEEFWFKLDLQDLEDSGAFIDSEIWNKYILKQKISVTPRDFTNRVVRGQT